METATPVAAPNAAQPQPPTAAPAVGGPSNRGSFAVRLANSPRPPSSPLAIPVAAKAAPAPGVSAVVTPPSKVAPEAPTALDPKDPSTPPQSADPTVTPPASAPPQPKTTVLGRGGKPMSDEAIAERVERERRRLLREEYGTDDETKVQAIKATRRADLEQYTKLKADQLERERAAMTKEQQLTTDLQTVQQENEQLRARIAEMETGQVVTDQTKQLTEIATRHIDESVVEFALGAFSKHLNKLGPEEIKRMTPRAIERWFRKFAEARPKFAKTTPSPEVTTVQTQTQTEAKTTATTPEQRPAVRRVPIVTSTKPKGGAPAAKPPAAPTPGLVNGKTFRPGQPNSMTDAEVKATLRQQGRRRW